MKKNIFKLIKINFLILILVCAGIFIYIKTSPKPEIYSANSLTLYDASEAVFFQVNDSKEWIGLD